MNYNPNASLGLQTYTFVEEGGWQTESDKVADHYRKEKEKGLVMDLAAHFGLRIKFVEGAEGDHTQPPTKAS